MLGWIELVDVGIGHKEPVDVPDLIQGPTYQHPFLAQTYGHAHLSSFLHILFCRDTWEVEILLRHVIGIEPAHCICAHSLCCLIENDHVPFGLVHRRTIFCHQRSITEERLKWRLVLQDSTHH